MVDDDSIFFFVLLCHAYRYASLDGITGYHKKYKADEEYCAWFNYVLFDYILHNYTTKSINL